MLAYVELVQRKEKEIGCDVLTHQKWFVWDLYIDGDTNVSLGVARIISIAFCPVCPLGLQAHLRLAKIPQNIASKIITVYIRYTWKGYL